MIISMCPKIFPKGNIKSMKGKTMFDKNKIEIGDVLQHKIRDNKDWLGKIIIFFSLSKKNYTHTAIYIGGGYKAEAHMKFPFRKVKIQENEFKLIDIYRTKKRINKDQKKQLMEATKKLYGKGYDSLGLAGTVRSSLGKIFNFDWFRNSKPIITNDDRFFCSEEVSNIYSAIDIDICPKVHESATTPADIGESEVLKKIC